MIGLGAPLSVGVSATFPSPGHLATVSRLGFRSVDTNSSSIRLVAAELGVAAESGVATAAAPTAIAASTRCLPLR